MLIFPRSLLVILMEKMEDPYRGSTTDWILGSKTRGLHFLGEIKDSSRIFAMSFPCVRIFHSLHGRALNTLRVKQTRLSPSEEHINTRKEVSSGT